MSLRRPLIALVGLVILAGCAPAGPPFRGPIEAERAIGAPVPGSPDSADALATVLRQHIEVLASDSFEGRHPTGRGGELSVAYVSEAFRRIGLRPGGRDGTYTQRVPMIRYTATTRLGHTVAGRELRLRSPDDLFAWSVDLGRMPPRPTVLADRELVFVGYGIHAPEYGWDDYGAADVRGRILLALPGDPPPSGSEEPPGERKRFDPNAPSPHASAGAKVSEAARRGAAALVLIVEPVFNGLTYEVYAQSLARERLVLEPAERRISPAEAETEALGPGRGMLMSSTAARRLVEHAGIDYAALVDGAASRDFTARGIPGRSSVRVTAEAELSSSANVLGMLEGSDPLLRHQAVVYLAHWDHIGRDTTREGDQIFNGAMDNAAGTAQLIEIARRFASEPSRPARSILFIATTAEEANLLGSTYYANHPTVPLRCTAAALNLDGGFPYGRTHDVVAIGAGNTTLDEILEDALAAQGRQRTSDSREVAYFPRSDHYALARMGVPALFVLPGMDVAGEPQGWGEEKLRYFMETHYHQPSDTLRIDHDLRGLAEDAELMLDVGRRVANRAEMPRWKDEAPFGDLRSIREEAMRGFTPESCVPGQPD